MIRNPVQAALAISGPALRMRGPGTIRVPRRRRHAPCDEGPPASGERPSHNAASGSYQRKQFATCDVVTPVQPGIPARCDHPKKREETFMCKSFRMAFSVAAVTLALTGISGNVLADTQWQKDHPRREQVNNRLANQNQRIRQERKEGEISKAQAAKLHQDDRAIRKEERTMASTNGSHISKAEKKALNQQENQVSRQIGR